MENNSIRIVANMEVTVETAVTVKDSKAESWRGWHTVGSVGLLLLLVLLLLDVLSREEECTR